MQYSPSDLLDTYLNKAISEFEGHSITMLDVDGIVTHWNIGAQKLKGYTEAEIIGKHIRVFYSSVDQQNHVAELLLQQAQSDKQASFEGMLVRSDTTTFWAKDNLSAIYDEVGELIGFYNLTLDLTKQKLYEIALEDRTKALEFKKNELEQFIYIATHDLQEPLHTINSLINMVQMQYEDCFDEEGITILKYIYESSSRMSNQVKGLLDYGRIGNGDYPKEMIDCNALILEIKNDMAFKINESKADIITSNLPNIKGYRYEIKSLLTNLIGNAIKFQQKSTFPLIEISVKEQDKNWLFCIKDNGIGIESMFLEKIFMIFRRLNSRKDYDGTGIGLAHALKIVELHEGHIWVESELNRGSTFYFTLSKK